MLEENAYKLIFRILVLLLLMMGGAMAIWICLIWSKVNKNLLKARIFLNEKFLRKLWFYMFIAMAFFALDQGLVLIFGYYGNIGILAEAFKVIFVGLVILVLKDYFNLIRSCVRSCVAGVN